jgi:hypothetical protein
MDSPHFNGHPHCIRDQIMNLPLNLFELLYAKILVPTNIDQDLYASIELQQ